MLSTDPLSPLILSLISSNRTGWNGAAIFTCWPYAKVSLMVPSPASTPSSHWKPTSPNYIYRTSVRDNTHPTRTARGLPTHTSTCSSKPSRWNCLTEKPTRDSIAEVRNQRPPVPHHRDGGKLKPEEDNILYAWLSPPRQLLLASSMRTLSFAAALN
jgi:hypothetical protein